MRLLRGTAALLAVTLAGCYSYAPHQGGPLVQAQGVRVHLASAMDVRLPEVTANNVAVVEGEVVRADSAEVVVSATMVVSNSGYEQLGQGATVVIPRARIGSIEARRLDLLRTAGLLGIVAGGTAVTYAANTGTGTKGTGSGGGTGEQ